MRSSRGSSSGSSSRWLAPGVAVAVVVGGLSWTLPAAAQPAAEEASPGQKDLDAAFDAKLAADDIDDYANVLDLCRRAIAKGLSEDQKRFAEDLYTDTLMYRAARVVQAIYNVERPDRQWPRLRLFAMRDLGEVVERNPGLGEAQLMIAQLESMPGGDRERAGAAARKALELLPDDRLQSARAHALLGMLSDDRAEQLSHYDKAVELAPGDKDIRRARGLFHLLEEKFDEARVDLESAIAADPEDASLQEALGLALMMDEKLDEAQEAFDRALELEPDSASALLQRARLRALRGDRPEAIADLDKAIGIAPDEALLLVLRARIHQQAGDSARAAADLERVLEKTPDHPAALELRGLIAADRQDYDAAIRDFRRLVSQRQDDVVLVSQLGMLYLMAKQPRQAIRRFSRGLEIDENNFPCRRGRSDAEISIGDHAAALADLEKALELEPDDPGVLNNLAWLLATSPDEAVRDGKRAIELATKACEATEWKQPHIVSTLAAGYAEAGDFETARKYSQRAVDAEGTAAEVRQQLEGELASYREGKPWRERQQQEERLPAAGPVEDDGPQKGPDAREEGGRDEDASPPPARDKGPTRRPFD